MGTKLENRRYDIANISISVGIFIYRNLSCEYDKQRVLQMFPWLCVFKAFWVPDDNHRHITNNRRKYPVCVCHCWCLLLFFFISFIFSPILTMPVFNEPVRQIHRKIEPIACPLIPKTDHLIRSNVKTIITGNFEILNANRLFFEAFTKKLLCEQLSSLC